MTYPTELAEARKKTWQKRLQRPNTKNRSEAWAEEIVAMERTLDELRHEMQTLRVVEDEATDLGFSSVFDLMDWVQENFDAEED